MSDFNIEWHVQFTEDGHEGFFWHAKGTELRKGVRVHESVSVHGERSAEGKRFPDLDTAEDNARRVLASVTENKRIASRKHKGVVFTL